MRLVLVVVLLAGGSARADALKGWAGASASAGYDDASREASTRTGPTATASDTWYQKTLYNAGPSSNTVQRLPVNTDAAGPSNGGYSFSNSTSGSSSGSADPHADSLLSVSAVATAGNPGSTNHSLSSLLPTGQAAWTGDRLTVSSPDGAVLPDVVRLQFRMNWEGTAPYRWDYYRENGAITATVNDRSFRFTDLWSGQSSFDSVDAGGHTALFHADLKLDRDGVSDLISLRLMAEAMASTGSNTGGYASQTAGLSIVGVNFADGTSLASRGYGVAFDSGLVVPGTVPEPASVVTWGLMAAGACGVLRRRGVGVRPRDPTTAGRAG